MEILKTDFNTKYSLRTKTLALGVIKLVKGCRQDIVNGVLLKQLLRSATSVAANFRAVCQARSTKERFSKLSIVIEELDEVAFWIEMLKDASIVAAGPDVEFLSRILRTLKSIFQLPEETEDCTVF